MAGSGTIRTAGFLMRMALALLDREGALIAAARLQHAIDVLEDGGSERLDVG